MYCSLPRALVGVHSLLDIRPGLYTSPFCNPTSTPLEAWTLRAVRDPGRWEQRAYVQQGWSPLVADLKPPLVWPLQ